MDKGDPITWDNWQRLSDFKSAAKSKLLAAAVREAAGDYSRHPRLRADLEEAIELAFDLSADALEAYEHYKTERGVVSRSGIGAYSMTEIDELGIAEVTRRAIEAASRGTAGIHLSFDIDGLDPEVAPGVGTPVRGGVNYREAHLFMEMIAESGALVGMDIVELNPVRDVKNSTAETVVHLVQSAFGRRIL